MNVVALFVVFWGITAVTSYDYPFQNPSLPWDERVDDLVSRLTLNELQDQMAKGGAGPSGGPAPAIPRLGIGPYQWNTECLRGVVAAGNATSFPQAIGLAASFSRQLIYDVAEVTSYELRGKFNYDQSQKMYGDHTGLSCFSPVINIVRDPRWGRNQETYGEDPYLTGELTTSFVHGLQGNNSRYIRANAGCKHFAAYDGPENIPLFRLAFDAQVPERDLRTTFLPAFRACVKAGTYSIMCSYNSVNGVPACANKYLLDDILRKEWNFKGYVISDEGALEFLISYHKFRTTRYETAILSANAGVNIELSASDPNAVYTNIAILDRYKEERLYHETIAGELMPEKCDAQAVSDGMLSEDLVRERVKPLFYTRMRLGEFDPPSMNPYNKINRSSIQSAAHRQLSLEAAMKSFVLLKNTKAFLPFTSQLGHIAVVGPMADNVQQLFGDYAADVMPQYVITPLKALMNASKSGSYGPGCVDNKCINYTSSEIQKAVTGADVIFVCVGTGQEIEAEGIDRSDIQLPGHQEDVIKDAVKYSTGPVVLLVFSASPVNISWAVSSSRVMAIIQCFFPAQEAGLAIVNTLMANKGSVSVPAARLPYTWPRLAIDMGDITDFQMKGKTYRYYYADPLFPFGYGLSYSSFNYSQLQYPATIDAGKNLTGMVMVQNTGKYDADEVVEVYISWENATVPTPKLQLVDFHRVFIPKTKSVQVTFTITAESMAVWVDKKGWVIEAGKMDLYVGGQQPNQETKVGSNVLHGVFVIQSTVFLGVY